MVRSKESASIHEMTKFLIRIFTDDEVMSYIIVNTVILCPNALIIDTGKNVMSVHYRAQPRSRTRRASSHTIIHANHPNHPDIHTSTHPGHPIDQYIYLYIHSPPIFQPSHPSVHSYIHSSHRHLFILYINTSIHSFLSSLSIHPIYSYIHHPYIQSSHHSLSIPSIHTFIIHKFIPPTIIHTSTIPLIIIYPSIHTFIIHKSIPPTLIHPSHPSIYTSIPPIIHPSIHPNLGNVHFVDSTDLAHIMS